MLSVIVPTLNEGEGAVHFVAHLLDIPDVFQIVVVDASDQSESIEQLERIANCERISLVRSNGRGRAKQMNLGADCSKGDNLLFLHSDTRLPADAALLVEEKLNDSKWGRFDLRLDQAGLSFRIIEFMINLRSRVTTIATGDQAIFVKRDFFFQQGGFANIALMEDIEFSRRLGKSWPPALITAPVITSARRWKAHGIIKTIVLMWKLRLLYRLGVNPEKLASMYYDSD